MIARFVLGVVFLLFAIRDAAAGAANADALLKAAFDNWRGKSSTTEIAMTVHRPDWERSLRMSVWTRGDDDTCCARLLHQCPLIEVALTQLKRKEDE